MIRSEISLSIHPENSSSRTENHPEILSGITCEIASKIPPDKLKLATIPKIIILNLLQSFLINYYTASSRFFFKEFPIKFLETPETPP